MKCDSLCSETVRICHIGYTIFLATESLKINAIPDYFYVWPSVLHADLISEYRGIFYNANQ